MIGDIAHPVGEALGVDNEVVGGAAAVRPAVVEDDVVVADVAEAGGYDNFAGVEEEGFGDVATEGVPVVLRRWNG